MLAGALINLKGLSLDSGLRLMLREIGCVHVVVDGTILITTEAEVRQLVTQGLYRLPRCQCRRY